MPTEFAPPRHAPGEGNNAKASLSDKASLVMSNLDAADKALTILNEKLFRPIPVQVASRSADEQGQPEQFTLEAALDRMMRVTAELERRIVVIAQGL